MNNEIGPGCFWNPQIFLFPMHTENVQKTSLLARFYYLKLTHGVTSGMEWVLRCFLFCFVCLFA